LDKKKWKGASTTDPTFPNQREVIKHSEVIMKVTEKRTQVNAQHILNVAVDVASRKLDVHFELPLSPGCQRVYQETIVNSSISIKKSLEKYHNLAVEQGYLNTRVVCEPTGPYSRNLLTLARDRNCLTAYVSGEAVKNAKVIEFNSHNKTDAADAQVIYSLAERNKVLVHREYSRDYACLRVLNTHYEDIDKNCVRARNQVHNTLKHLFPDCSLDSDALYSKTGQAIYSCYRFNPWLITAYGYSKFEARIKKKAKYARKKTLRKIFDEAKASCLKSTQELATSLSMCLSAHYDDFLINDDRKKQLREQMCELLGSIRLEDEQIPAEQKDFVSEFHIARLLAETGPLSDFKNFNQLNNYLGLNLRERQSGTYKGRAKLSKRGRPLARKVLSLIILPLVKESALYGPAYHKEKKRSGKPGKLLMCNYMKKWFKAFFGIYRSHSAFDKSRLFIDRGSYEKLKASA